MKKTISFLLLISLLLTMGTLTAFADEGEISPIYWIAETTDIDPEDIPGTVLGIKGDTDMSGAVNVKDATAIQKHVANITILDELAIHISDVDFSNKINVKDATAIQKWVAGIVAKEESYINHIYYEAYALDERLFGKWECTTDIAPIINEMLLLYAEENPLLAEYIKISSCPIKETYEFIDDYSYTIIPDETTVNNAVNTIKSDLAKGMDGYLVALAKDMGMNMTAEEVLAIMGYSSMESCIDEVFPTDMIIEAATPTMGYYRTTPDGKIYLDEYSDTFYNFYTIEGNTFKLTGDNENLAPELYYPIILEKVN